MAEILTPLSKVFCTFVEDRYKGKVHSIERVRRPDFDGLVVNVAFRLPPDLDELEIFRRINKVLEVVTEGKEE